MESFKTHHANQLRQYPERIMVLVIDFDKDSNRKNHIQTTYIPEDLRHSVFILGVFSEPEPLKKNTGLTLSKIGEMLAQECNENTYTLWEHALLKHNSDELNRLIPLVKPFLFN